MIKNNTRKVYIVNDFKSDKFEQAIFILKQNCVSSGKTSVDLALEAQKIIDDYIVKIENEKNHSVTKKKSKQSHLKYFAAIMLFLAVIGTVSYFLMLGLLNIF